MRRGRERQNCAWGRARVGVLRLNAKAYRPGTSWVASVIVERRVCERTSPHCRSHLSGSAPFRSNVSQCRMFPLQSVDPAAPGPRLAGAEPVPTVPEVVSTLTHAAPSVALPHHTSQEARRSRRTVIRPAVSRCSSGRACCTA